MVIRKMVRKFYFLIFTVFSVLWLLGNELLISFSTLQLSTEQCGKHPFSTPLRVFSTLLSTKTAKIKKSTLFAYFPGTLWKTVDSRLFAGIFLFSRWRNENLKQDLPLSTFGLEGQNNLLSIPIFHLENRKFTHNMFSQLFSITVTGK